MRQFFDTNVLVYSYDPRDQRKRDIASELIERAVAADSLVVSTQVLTEFYATALRVRLLGASEALGMVRLWSEHDTVPHTSELVVRGLQLHQAHSLSVWDALIVQAAIEARCDVLLSEDLQHGRRFGDLEVSNPFLGAGMHEPASKRYRVPAKTATSRRRKGAR